MLILPARRAAAVFAGCFLLSAAAIPQSGDAPSPAAPAAPAPAKPSSAPVPSPAPAAVSADLLRGDPATLIGATVGQAVSALGAPRTVRAARGPEPWQDDVVFAYEGADLYFFKDRVWQVRASAAYGIRVGSARDEVTAALGEPLQRYESDFVYQRPSRAWPLRMRLRFGADGAVSDVFLYRADF